MAMLYEGIAQSCGRTGRIALVGTADEQVEGELRHLFDLGHRRIDIILGPGYASSARGRQEGYLRALGEQDIGPDPDLIIDSTFSIDAGTDAALTLMRLSSPPTAIFAVNDNTAIGAMSALLNLGLRVPEDVSLVGYNDIPIVGCLPTPLTTLRVPFDQIAMTALDLLISGRSRPCEPIQMAAPTLIPRRSTMANGGKERTADVATREG